MKTSELPSGTVIKFKSFTKIHSFYDRVEDWTHDYDSLKLMRIDPGMILTIVKTKIEKEWVAQTVMLPTGVVKVLFYIKGTFFDENKGSYENIDLTLNDYFYDVM